MEPDHMNRFERINKFNCCNHWKYLQVVISIGWHFYRKSILAFPINYYQTYMYSFFFLLRFRVSSFFRLNEFEWIWANRSIGQVQWDFFQFPCLHIPEFNFSTILIQVILNIEIIFFHIDSSIRWKLINEHTTVRS